jgi:hypothetical protein
MNGKSELSSDLHISATPGAKADSGERQRDEMRRAVGLFDPIEGAGYQASIVPANSLQAA